MRRRMQPRQLKSLVETGHYKPEPSLIADAMLQRRGVRELLTSESFMRAGRIPPAPASRPPGSLISTPLPATTSPIWVSAIPSASSHRPRRLVELLRRDAGQQLVVLAAAEQPAEGSRPAPRSAPRTPAASGSAAASIRRPTPLRSARWPASPPSPSLRSIIAVAPAAGERSAGRQPRRGLELPRPQDSASCGHAANRPVGRRAGAGRPRRRRSRRSGPARRPGWAPARVTSALGSAAWPTTVIARKSSPAPGQVAAGEVGAGVGGEREHAVEQLDAARPRRGRRGSPRTT